MCSKKNGKATCSSSSSNWLITAILSHPFTSIQLRSHRGLAACRARVVSSTVNHRSRSRGLIRGSPRSCTTRRLYFVAYNARDDNRTNPIISPPDEPSDPMQIAYVALVMWAKWLEWKLLGTRCGGQIVRARSNSRILASRYICMYMVTGFFSFFNSTRDWAD